MNRTNHYIAKHMQKREYLTFLKNALGLFHFLDNTGMKLIGSTNSKKKEKDLFEFGILMDSQGKKVNTYYLCDDNRENLEFVDEYDNVYNIENFFDKVFDDSILFCLLISSKSQKTPFVYDEIINKLPKLDESSIREMLDMEVETLPFFEKKELKRYSFILGAGINNKLGPSDWDKLIADMRSSILKLTPLTGKDLDDFKDKICNTTYVIPQILKDLDENEYFNVLDQSIYGKFVYSNISLISNPKFENTTMYQVARILSNNVLENKALTFNYDEILEMVLDHNFGIKVNPIFKGRASAKSLPTVYHPHGFWPYTKKKSKIYQKSIVLSSLEYMENYQTLKDYSAEKLNSFIDDTCILVGNSLSDYEEQKIFKGHHKKNMAQYSFLFMCENDLWRRKYYLIYFLQMGVIPIYFKSFDEMVNYLKKL